MWRMRRVGVANAATRPAPHSLSKSRGYSLAFASVVIALGTSLLLAAQRFKGVEFPLFLMAIALTLWYAGVDRPLSRLCSPASLSTTFLLCPSICFISHGKISPTMLFSCYSRC